MFSQKLRIAIGTGVISLGIVFVWVTVKVQNAPQSLTAANNVSHQRFSPVVLTNNELEYNDSDNSKIEGLIYQLASNDSLESQKAADMLATIGADVVPSLERMLPDSDIFLKGEIIFLLGRIADKHAMHSLCNVLHDENGYIRRNAAEALGKIKDHSSIHDLAVMLFDADSDVRVQAAWALGNIAQPQAVESLLNRLIDEKTVEVKSMVIQALGRIADSRAVPALVSIVKSDKEGLLLKEKAIIALGMIGDVSAQEPLQEYVALLRKTKFPDFETDVFRAELISTAIDAMLKIDKFGG